MQELQGEMQQGNQQQRPAPAPVRKVEQQAAQAAEVIDETTNEANKGLRSLDGYSRSTIKSVCIKKRRQINLLQRLLIITVRSIAKDRLLAKSS
ncbi:hypothetical protein KEH51_16995 [[Brevibacterium] frigoritolerans]|uniref:Uncharacterized protein n=1 Tax=Peribacillus frigoritolerans TaxID=450367 RepID=A0A941FPH0_9BACI|nr:hypothetical protein [Peribacillus frigoritolerans]